MTLGGGLVNHSASVLEKLVLVAGLTGVRLRAVYHWLRGEALGKVEGLDGPDCVVLYEDVLMEGMKLGGCIGIDQLASILQVSREAGRHLFVEAAGRLVKRLEAKGCRRAVVFIHLSYMAGGVVVANPALAPLLAAAEEASVIYLVDDYYDALDRIERRVRAQVASGSRHECRTGPVVSPFKIDPLEYLSWRATDYNLLTTLESFKPEMETFILGVKHPPTVFLRLLDSLLGGGVYEYVYASHPISGPRHLYAAGHASSLKSLTIVLAIEAFKAALLRAHPNLVLFDPTTVDEYLADPAVKALEWLPCHKPSGPSKKGCLGTVASEVGLKPDEVVKRLREAEPGVVVEHSLRVKEDNRWPLPIDTIYEAASGSGYPYRQGGDEIYILDKRFTDLYGGPQQFDRLISAVVLEVKEDALSNVIKLLKGMKYSEKARVYAKLLEHVARQIEMRDYHYVSQARAIAVILPVIIEVVEDGKNRNSIMYYVWSRGAEAEMHRAIALGKPLVVYMLPIMSDSLTIKPDMESQKPNSVIFNHMKKSILRKCAEHTIKEDGGGASGWAMLVSLTEACTEKIGGLFAPSRHATHFCLVPVVIAASGFAGVTYNPTGDYYEDLRELAELYEAALKGGACAPTSGAG